MLDSISRVATIVLLQLCRALQVSQWISNQAIHCMMTCLMTRFLQLTLVVSGLLSFPCAAFAAATTQIPVPNIKILSPAGPKSGTSRRWHLSPGWLGVLLFLTFVCGARGARVAEGVATSAGAGQPFLAGAQVSAKQGDEQVMSGTRKRAFRRAQNRTTRFGATFYRGQVLTRKHLQAQAGAQTARPTLSTARSKPVIGRLPSWPPESNAGSSLPRRDPSLLSVLSINAGGITGELYDELCLWLETPTTINALDVVFIQETWRESSDYCLPQWSWIASGKKPVAGQGVAIVINKRLADPAAIRSREVRVGRILQVQVPLRDDHQSRLLNLVNVYVPAKVSESQQVYDKRAAVWNALTSFLEALPSRHLLCLAGDFNTDLLQDPTHVGCTHTLKGKARTVARDQPIFQELLRTHTLQAINTWSNQSTYIDPSGLESRVDFILTKPLQATGNRAAAQPQIRFATWREGARHLPLFGQLDLKAWQRFRTRQPPTPRIDTQALCKACNAGPEQERLRQVFRLHQHRFTAELPPEQAETILQQVCIEAFPPAQAGQTARQWQQPATYEDLSLTWQIRRHLKALAWLWPGRRQVFQAWKLQFLLKRRTQELKRGSRQRRREHWQAQLAEAEKAGQTTNPLKFFQVVNRLSPKRSTARVQIRGEDGRILTPAQEDQALA